MQANAAAPVRPSAPVVTTQRSGPTAITLVNAPTTRAEMKALTARRDEISRQISNITGRRDDIASQLRAAAPGADKAGLEARLGTLDNRIVELETDLNVTGRQLASAKGDAAAFTEQPPPGASNEPSPGQITAMSVVFMVAVLMPLSIALGRRLMGRGSKQQPAAASPEIVQRLDRMDEGLEAIAIEIERISEGQRFVTRVLADGATPALGAGSAQPIAVPIGERVPAERRI